MRAINVRKGKAQFGIWIFFKDAGNEEKFGQIASVLEAARSNNLNCCIGHTRYIREKRKLFYCINWDLLSRFRRHH